MSGHFLDTFGSCDDGVRGPGPLLTGGVLDAANRSEWAWVLEWQMPACTPALPISQANSPVFKDPPKTHCWTQGFTWSLRRHGDGCQALGIKEEALMWIMKKQQIYWPALPHASANVSSPGVGLSGETPKASPSHLWAEIMFQEPIIYIKVLEI